VNKVLVIGNLGQDPDMKYTADGQAVTSFSVASNRKYKTSSNEQRDETEWFQVVAWGKLAETCNEYLSKGKQVYVEGRLHSKTWEDRNGEKRFTNEIVLANVEFLGGGRDDSDGPGQESGKDVPATVA